MTPYQKASLKTVWEQAAKPLIRTFAICWSMVFYLFGIAYELPPYLTKLAESPSFLVNTVLSMAIVLWAMLAMVILALVMFASIPNKKEVKQGK